MQQFTKQIADTPGYPSFNLNLYVKSDYNPPREDFELEDNLCLLRKELQQNILYDQCMAFPIINQICIRIYYMAFLFGKEEKSEIDKIKTDDSVRELGTD